MKKIAFYTLIAVITVFAASCKKTDAVTPPVVVPPVVVVDSLKIGLLAYYPFNNSGADSSGKGNDAVTYYAITSTTNRFGKANSAFHFDGATSYMIVKDNADLRLNNVNFTTNVWIYMEAYNTSFGSEVLCKRGTGSTNGWNYSINGNAISNGGLIGATSFQVSGGTDPLAAGSKTVGLNAWHMLTTVYDVTKKQITFYVDGVFDNTLSNIPTPSSTATADLYIGADSQSSAYYLKGKLDEMRIYNRALTLKQIQKLYALTN
jgi:hypothetical protein